MMTNVVKNRRRGIRWRFTLTMTMILLVEGGGRARDHEKWNSK